MTRTITCDLCQKRIVPVGASDSIMGSLPYGDRIEATTYVGVRRGFWTTAFRRGPKLVVENVRNIDAHPECLDRLFAPTNPPNRSNA